MKTVFSRDGKSEFPLERCKKLLVYLFPDAHGPVALHVRVAADRADARARLADLAAEKMQVDDVLDGFDRSDVLRDTHRPAGDHPFGAHDHFGGFGNLPAAQAAGG